MTATAISSIGEVTEVPECRRARWVTGDDLVELDVSRQAREYDPSLPKTFTARAVKDEKKGFRPQTVLTSLTDPDGQSVDIPAPEDQDEQLREEATHCPSLTDRHWC